VSSNPNVWGLAAARRTHSTGHAERGWPGLWQIFIDTYANASFAKLHDCKTPIMAADLESVGSCPSTRRTTPYRRVNSAAPTAAECELPLAVKNIDPPMPAI
jgi:hypothetical protein